MRRLLLPAVLLVMLSGCPAPSHGPLGPLAGAGIELVSTHGQPNDTARLTGGGVTADVTGHWSARNESIEIRYRSGRRPVLIDMASASIVDGRAAPATEAWNRSVREPGSPIGGRVLASGVRLAAGADNLVLILYDRGEDRHRPSIGDQVSVAVPMPGGARAVRFRVAGE